MSAAGSLIGPKNDELAISVYKTASFHLFGSFFFCFVCLPHVLKMKQTLVLVKQEGNIWLETHHVSSAKQIAMPETY